jgi:hypothetical protein
VLWTETTVRAVVTPLPATDAIDSGRGRLGTTPMLILAGIAALGLAAILEGGRRRAARRTA